MTGRAAAQLCQHPAMDLRPYDLRDPGEIVAQIASEQPLRDGDARLLVVEDPSRTQQVTHVCRLDQADWKDLEPWRLSDYLREQVQQLPLPPSGPETWCSVVTVVARPGFAVFGAQEMPWMYAWRYSNHLRRLFSGDIVLVTDHGWHDFMTGWGGHEPRITAYARPHHAQPAAHR
jgi:hypothetical protein